MVRDGLRKTELGGIKMENVKRLKELREVLGIPVSEHWTESEFLKREREHRRKHLEGFAWDMEDQYL